MEALRDAYTEVWVPSAIRPLVGFANLVRPIASTGIDLILPGRPVPRNTLDLLRGFDDIVSWYGANRPDFRAAVQELNLPFRFFDALPPFGDFRHATEFFLNQIGFGGPVAPHIYCPPVPAAEDFIVIHPFSGGRSKNWPLANFREVAQRLPLPVSWCAGPEEPLDDAVRIDDLYELGCWLASARLYIGNDSGITHLAAAVGTPVIALVKRMEALVWRPLGPRVHVIAGELESISVDRVVEAAEALLSHCSENAT
jgi:heptosyltransferase-3